MKRVFSFYLLVLALCGAVRGQVTPRIFSVSPGFAVTGNPTLTITVSGEFFHSGSTVEWNGAALSTTYVSVGELTASVPAADMAYANTAQINVANNNGAVSPPVRFTVYSNPPVYSWSPQQFTPGQNASVRIIGDHFWPGAEAIFDGKCYSSSIQFISPYQLSAQIPGSCITGTPATAHSISVSYNGAVAGLVPDTNTTTPVTATVSPAAVSFGSQIVNTSSASGPLIFTLSGGQTVLRISSISVSSGPFSQTNNCPSQLAVGTTCSVSCRFRTH